MAYKKNYVSRQKYWAIKNAPTVQEQKLIAYYELLWLTQQTIPTIAEVSAHLKVSQVTVNYYLGKRKCVIEALKNRGIPYEQHTQSELTATQVAAASLVMNFSDDRSITYKLDSIGVNATQYQAWLRDPQFKHLLDSLGEQNKINIKPHALAEFTRLVNKGDWNAIKYYLDATGELSDDTAPQSETLIMMFVEIIQRHVKDQGTIDAIATDLKLAAGVRSTVNVIESTAVSDEEVENAKKMLGI